MVSRGGKKGFSHPEKKGTPRGDDYKQTLCFPMFSPTHFPASNRKRQAHPRRCFACGRYWLQQLADFEKARSRLWCRLADSTKRFETCLVCVVHFSCHAVIGFHTCSGGVLHACFGSGQGKFDESDSLFEECVDMKIAARGPRHPSVADSLHNWAASLYMRVSQAKHRCDRLFCCPAPHGCTGGHRGTLRRVIRSICPNLRLIMRKPFRRVPQWPPICRRSASSTCWCARRDRARRNKTPAPGCSHVSWHDLEACSPEDAE